MILDSFGLTTAYIALAVLLLVLLVYSRAPLLLKGAMIMLVSAFYYVTFLSLPDFFGWPTAHVKPKHLQIVAIHIDAPNKIYFWGHDVNDGVALKRPRAYELTYTTKLADSLNKASNKLKKGFPMMGEFIPTQVQPQRSGDDGALKEQDKFELIIFDMPEGMVPPGGKE